VNEKGRYFLNGQGEEVAIEGVKSLSNTNLFKGREGDWSFKRRKKTYSVSNSFRGGKKGGGEGYQCRRLQVNTLLLVKVG